jgi:hypothetical protein
VVFYELLTGDLPLGRFPAPSIKAKTDPRLDPVVMKALEHEPDRRYQHASQVKTDVESIAGSAALDRPCPNCGKAIRAGASICPFCGARFDPPSPVPALRTGPKDFSIDEALRYGWNAMTKHFGFFLLMLLALIGVEFATSFLIGIVQTLKPALGLALRLPNFALSILTAMGSLSVALVVTSGRAPKAADFFAHFHRFLPYLGASILYGLIVLGGFILLIIPGFIFAIMFQFWSCLMLDQRLGPVEALKRSRSITRGVKWKLFAFALLMWAINLLGTLACCIGLFATLPLTLVATVWVYRQLLAQTP